MSWKKKLGITGVVFSIPLIPIGLLGAFVFGDLALSHGPTQEEQDNYLRLAGLSAVTPFVILAGSTVLAFQK